MGLDIVELVMSIEESFGLELPDAEAEKLVTPAQLIEYILSQVKLTDQSVCLSRRTFYALRRTLMADFACTRRQVKPDVLLESLIPRPNRRAAWQRTQAALQSKSWPELHRPAWLVIILFVVFAGSSIGFWAAGLPPWAAALLGVVPWRLALIATKPFRTEFPQSCLTAGELARFLVGHAPGLLAPTGRVWTREEVAVTVRRLTIEHLGLRPEQYREDARFVEDLGAG
jgi:acyl carrier protein